MSTYIKLLTLITASILAFGGAILAQEEQTNTVDPEGLRRALTNIQMEISELQALTSISSENIQFVDVGPAITAQGSQADTQTGGVQTGGAMTGGSGATDEAEGEQAIGVEELISQNQQQIVALHGAIEANGALSELMETQNIESDDVVAVDLSDNGQVVVFYAQVEPQETEASEAQPEISPMPEDDTGDDSDTDDDTSDDADDDAGNDGQ